MISGFALNADANSPIATNHILVQDTLWRKDHLESTNPQVASRYYTHFVTLVNNSGEVIIEATKTSITFKSPGLFAVVH